MKLIVTLFAIFISQISIAQNQNPQREAFKLKLPVDGVDFYEEDIKSTSYFVHNDILQIYPTEKVLVEVELKNDTIFSMKTVKRNLNPKSTIEIEFSQKAKGGKSEMMMLKVTNPFSKKLEYKAHMYIVGNDKWLETSIEPVQPKLVGYETWTDVIITLALDSWRLVK